MGFAIAIVGIVVWVCLYVSDVRQDSRDGGGSAVHLVLYPRPGRTVVRYLALATGLAGFAIAGS